MNLLDIGNVDLKPIFKLMEKKNAPKDLGTKQADIIREPLVYFLNPIMVIGHL